MFNIFDFEDEENTNEEFFKESNKDKNNDKEESKKPGNTTKKINEIIEKLNINSTVLSLGFIDMSINYIRETTNKTFGISLENIKCYCKITQDGEIYFTLIIINKNIYLEDFVKGTIDKNLFILKLTEDSLDFNDINFKNQFIKKILN